MTSPQPDPKSKPKAGQEKPQDAQVNRDYEDPVNEASDESFPASDPPAWTDTAASRDGD